MMIHILVDRENQKDSGWCFIERTIKGNILEMRGYDCFQHRSEESRLVSFPIAVEGDL